MKDNTKYKLLSVHRKDVAANNIGDYIQALAASQFFPEVDGFIDREKLKEYGGEPCKMIMNGWYMHDPSQWPPAPQIDPLFVAFHLNVTAKDMMLSEEGIEYLKKYQPIGCRDRNTAEMLNAVGVDTYFSGCLTLTLGYKYKSEEKEEKCYVVDPKIPSSKSPMQIVKDVVFWMLHNGSVRKVAKKLFDTCSIKEQRVAARYLQTYSRYVDLNTLVDAEYIHQQNEKYTKGFNSDEERLHEAERLVRLYSRAKLVITSRIHCALPCLGLETPVVFIHYDNESVISKCRFAGLEDLFNTFVCSGKGIKPNFQLEEKISLHNPVKNKGQWKSYADNLISKCKEFVS